MKEKEIIEKLSPLEIKIIPYLNLSIDEIESASQLDRTSVIRALKFLESKELLKIKSEKSKIIDLGTNGIFYKKSHLPERTLLNVLEKQNRLTLVEAKTFSKLSDNEFKVSLGVLKSKAFIELKEGRIILTAKKEELSRKMIEEIFLESLPLELSSLLPEQKLAFQNLQKRKDIIELKEESEFSFMLTSLGEKLAGKKIESDLIEEVTPDLIKSWKKEQQFRKYDVGAAVPRIFGGKKHFVSEAIEHGKKIWLELGFEEMAGAKTQTSFWNFDALFTSQDHPVREMQDTFFIKNTEGKLPEKKFVEQVKKSHESGVAGSKGWDYSWKSDEARRVVLRTHTTALSAATLSKIKISDLPKKYFAIGKCFRNETVDWSHGFEFNQSEGIVVDRNANFSHLLGYLKEFYNKMGFSEIKFTPSFFPYTEPSLEIYAYHNEKQKWIELGGAGIFRPEVTVPLLGEAIPVLAWGPGFDRLMIMAYKIADLREVYKNDLKFLRERKVKTE